MANRPGGWTALRWGLKPGSYQVTARPVGPSSTIAHPDRQIESKARSQSQRESGPGRDRRAHHRSHEAAFEPALSETYRSSLSALSSKSWASSFEASSTSRPTILPSFQSITTHACWTPSGGSQGTLSRPGAPRRSGKRRRHQSLRHRSLACRGGYACGGGDPWPPDRRSGFLSREDVVCDGKRHSILNSGAPPAGPPNMMTRTPTWAGFATAPDRSTASWR